MLSPPPRPTYRARLLAVPASVKQAPHQSSTYFPWPPTASLTHVRFCRLRLSKAPSTTPPAVSFSNTYPYSPRSLLPRHRCDDFSKAGAADKVEHGPTDSPVEQAPITSSGNTWPLILCRLLRPCRLPRGQLCLQIHDVASFAPPEALVSAQRVGRKLDDISAPHLSGTAQADGGPHTSQRAAGPLVSLRRQGAFPVGDSLVVHLSLESNTGAMTVSRQAHPWVCSSAQPPTRERRATSFPRTGHWAGSGGFASQEQFSTRGGQGDGQGGEKEVSDVARCPVDPSVFLVSLAKLTDGCLH